MTGRHRRVLILGGGDGLALREVLRHRGVGSVTLVDPDARLVALARDDPALARLNRHAYRDPRVRVAAADVFDWLRRERPPRPPGGYDVVLADLPDPGISRSAKLYSQEFYGLVRRALAPGGQARGARGRTGCRPARLLDGRRERTRGRTAHRRLLDRHRPRGRGLGLRPRRPAPGPGASARRGRAAAAVAVPRGAGLGGPARRACPAAGPAPVDTDASALRVRANRR